MKSPRFSFQEREALKSQAKSGSFDLVVIGGGATGAAAARDAALRGLKVCLLESGDFASGTSSGSSKLVHGGIRYLENFEFKLVFEAIRERERLEELYAPLVRKIPFVFPTYKNRAPSKSLLQIGLTLYDSFSFFKERHRALNLSKAKKEFPLLKDEQLTGAMLYSDSFTEDYRLVVEMIKAAHRHSAICLSRCPVRSIEPIGKEFVLGVEDVWSEGADNFQVRASRVLNCAGPFSDEIRALLHLENRLHLTQGVHFVVKRNVLPINEAYVLPDPELDRILFAIPWGPSTYFGTTDTKIDRVEAARATQEDLNYVLKIINKHFKRKIEASDVIQSWAAVRPLIQPSKDEKSNSKISREHQIEENPPGLYHILGGKLTSHRLMAEEAVDLICEDLNIRKSSSTKSKALQDRPWKQTTSDRLGSRYGHFAEEVKSIDEESSLKGKIIFEEALETEAELIYAIRHEMCLHPMDFLRRRSALYYQCGKLEAARRVFEVMIRELSYSPQQQEKIWQECRETYEWDQQGWQKKP